MATVLTCNSCNEIFESEASQREHYRSDWHRYNLKRKVAGLPGVTRGWFERRREAVANLSGRDNESKSKDVYKCSVCGKIYGSTKAYDNHLQSKAHLGRAATVPGGTSPEPIILSAPSKNRELMMEQMGNGTKTGQRDGSGSVEERFARLRVGKESEKEDASDNDGSGDEWEDVDEEEAAVLMAEATDVVGKGGVRNDGEEEGEELVGNLEEWEVEECLFCGEKGKEGNLEGCVEHMHRQHGFFIPDAEYLVKPSALLQYLGLKVSRGCMCLYCDDRGKHFEGLEAVRRHMLDKNHCKLRWGDGTGTAEEELEEFYDYSSSYGGEENMRMILSGEGDNSAVSVTSSGMELVIPRDAEGGGVRVIGSREMARYYRQKPRPSDSRDAAISTALVARYKSMGLTTGQSAWRDKVNKRADNGVRASQRAEMFRTKLGLKNNVIRNLPKNVTF